MPIPPTGSYSMLLQLTENPSLPGYYTISAVPGSGTTHFLIQQIISGTFNYPKSFIVLDVNDTTGTGGPYTYAISGASFDDTSAGGHAASVGININHVDLSAYGFSSDYNLTGDMGIQGLQVYFTNPNPSLLINYPYAVYGGAFTTDTKNYSVTAVNVKITSAEEPTGVTEIKPSNISASYSYGLSSSGGSGSGSWAIDPAHTDAGFLPFLYNPSTNPNGFKIDVSTGAITAVADTNRKLTIDSTGKYTVRFIYTDAADYLNKSPVYVDATIYCFDINSDAGNINAFPPAYVGSEYNDSVFIRGAISEITSTSDFNATKAAYAASHKPAGFDNTSTVSYGTLDSEITLEGIYPVIRVFNASSTTIIGVASIAVNFSFPITLTGSIFTGFSIAKSINFHSAVALFTFAPNLVSFKTSQGAIIDLSCHSTLDSSSTTAYRWGTGNNIGYTFSNDPADSGCIDFTGVPPNSSYQDNFSFNAKLKNTLSVGTYNVVARRAVEYTDTSLGGQPGQVAFYVTNKIPVVIDLTLNGFTPSNRVSTSYISNISVGDGITNVQINPSQTSLSFSVTPHANLLANLDQGVYEFANPVSSAGSVYDYVKFDGTTNIFVKGKTCTVSLKNAIPPDFIGSIDLVFKSYADENLEAKRVKTISVIGSVATLVISGSLPAGTDGASYAASALTSTGVGPFTWSIVEAINPLTAYNLALNPTTGVISSGSGVITGSGTPAFTVKVVDSTGAYGSHAYSIAISPALGNPTITSTSLNSNPSIIVPVVINKTSSVVQTFYINGTNFGTADTVVVKKNGGTETITVGTPTVSSTQITVTVSIAAAAAATAAVYDISVSRTAPTASSAVTVLSALTVYSPASAIVWSGLSADTTASGSQAVLTLTGSNLGTDGSSGNILSFQNGGSPTTGTVTISNGGTTGVVTITALPAAATYSLLYTRAGDGQTATKNFTVTAGTLGNVTLAVTGGSSYTGSSSSSGAPSVPCIKSSSFNATLTCAGGSGSYTWQQIDGIFPFGLSLTGSTGVISGTVGTGALSASLSFLVTDTVSHNTKKVWFTFSVSGGSDLLLASQTLTVAQGNTSVDVAIVITGGNNSYTKTFTKVTGSFPDSLSLVSSTGHIIGSCTAAVGNYVTTINVTEATSGLTSTGTVTIAVVSALTNPHLVSLTPNTGAIAGGTKVDVVATDLKSGFNLLIDATDITTRIVNGSINLSLGTFSFLTPSTGSAYAAQISFRNTDNQVSNSLPFTYQNVVAPVFTSMDDIDGPFSGEQQTTIYGNNFTSDLSVKINGVLCTNWTGGSSIFISSTEAKIKTPAYTSFPYPIVATSVPIVLSNAAGDFSPTTQYTYRPPPTITAVVPPSGPSIGGTTIYITGKNFWQRNGKKPRVFIGSVEVPTDNITLIES